MTGIRDKAISVERSNGACIVTLNRPQKCNAIDIRMVQEMAAAALAADPDPEVSALILYGGPDLFSAGADLNEILEIRDPAAAETYFGHWHHLTRTFEALRKPVIAAIEGYCFTGGLELALAADIRIAGAGATFAITSARIGTVAGAGATQRLPRIVGTGKALEMLFSGDPIDAPEARRIGLVNRLVGDGCALDEALAYAAVYRERAPIGLAYAKQAVRRGMQTDLLSGLELETELVKTIYGTEDKHEGISAFLQKRKPRFRGR